MNMKHKHGEAFKLMCYATDDGTVREFIWNSRDGVTPFIVHTKDKSTTMTHVDWNNDRYDPQYIPKLGDRVFVDATVEDCIQWKRNWWSRYSDDPAFIEQMSESYPDLSSEQICQKLGRKEFTEHGEPPPKLIVVDEGVLSFLTKRNQQ